MNQIKINTVNLRTANKLFAVFYNERTPLYVWGKPSTAKTSSIKQFAMQKAKELGERYSEEEFGEGIFTCKTITLSQMDSPDLRGMPCVSVDKNGKEVTKFIPTEELPREGHGILLFDELNNGDETTLKAAYQIILDGAYGNLPVVKDKDGKDAFWRVAASNTEDDFCNTTPLPLALLRRFSHILVEPDAEEVINYFISQNEDSRVIGYLKAYPTDLFPKEWDEKLLLNKANPFPSQWQNVSKLIKNLKNNDLIIMDIVSSCVGQGVAGKFVAFIKTANKINWVNLYKNTTEEMQKLKKDEQRVSLMYALMSEVAMAWKLSKPVKDGNKTIKFNDKIVIDVILELEKELQLAFMSMLNTINKRKFITLASEDKKLNEVLKDLGNLIY